MTRRKMTDNIYRKYEAFVYWCARSWNKTTGVEVEELVGIAALNLVESFKAYDSTRGELTTYAKTRIDNAIKDFLSSVPPIPADIDIDLIPSESRTEEALRFKELLSSLGQEAGEVVTVLLKDAREVGVNGTEGIRELRIKVKSYMEKRFPNTSANIWNEIKLAIREYL